MEQVFSEYFPYVRHAAAWPAPGVAIDPTRHPVVIVGGGPTGLALALGLANFGVRSVVIEEDDTVCSGSRAGAFTRRTLEIFERLGIIDEVMRTGHGWQTGWTYFRDREIFRLDMPHDENQQYPPAVTHLQNLIEHQMVDAAARSGLVDVRWQHRMVGLEQDPHRVRVELETPFGRYALEADRLVACDGGRSSVRERMGLRMSGERYEGRYVIIDIRIDTEGMPVGRRCWFDPPSKPGSTLLMYKKPNGMLRFDYQLNEDDDEIEATRPESVFAEVDRHLKALGVDRPWEPVWMTLYRASALTLDRYLHGRVLFAGDAAHLVPIFGVRGMNSAIDDAHNLAWKLSLVATGRAGEALLETYSEERVYAARENHRYAMKSAEFMSPPTAGFRLMRDAALSLAERHPRLATLANPRQHAAIPLLASPLNSLPERSVAFESGPAPGEILPECPIRIRGRDGFITNLLGPWFTALYFSSDGGMPPELESLVAEFPMRSASIGAVAAAEIHDYTGRLFPLYDAVPGSVVLVRPDGHVMARWRSVPMTEIVAELRPSMERALGYSTCLASPPVSRAAG